MDATAIEIKYMAGAAAKGRAVKMCKTFISDKGVVRVTFERVVLQSAKVPVLETYEYHIAVQTVKEHVLDAFGWSALLAEDTPKRGQPHWQLTVYQSGKNLKLKGSVEPVLFGSRLCDAVLGLVKYKVKPILFG